MEEKEINKSRDPFLIRYLKNFNYEKFSDKSLIHDKKSIRKEEENFDFSKEGLINFFVSYTQNKELTILYDKPNDPFFANFNKYGSVFTKDFYLGYHNYSLDITDLENVNHPEVIYNLMMKPELCQKWDKNVKLHEFLVEPTWEDEAIFSVSRKHFYSPIMIISERDIIDKNILFYIDDILFSFSSSVPEGEYKELEKDVIRIIPQVCLFVIRIEKTGNTKHAVFHGLTQCDPKMPCPDWFLNFFLPTKCKEWYKSLHETLIVYNKSGYDGVKNLK